MSGDCSRPNPHRLPPQPVAAPRKRPARLSCTRRPERPRRLTYSYCGPVVLTNVAQTIIGFDLRDLPSHLDLDYRAEGWCRIASGDNWGGANAALWCRCCQAAVVCGCVPLADSSFLQKGGTAPGLLAMKLPARVPPLLVG
eukprot:3672402-Prymnesium_polylepis.1